MLSLQVVVLALAAAGAPETVLYDFYGDYCQPCRQMEPTIQRLLQLGYPVKKVNCSQQPALAQQFRVQSVPCFVLVSGGREVDRVVGATSFARLEEMFRRAGARPRDEAIARSRGQSPERPATFAPANNVGANASGASNASGGANVAANAGSASSAGLASNSPAPSNDAFATTSSTGTDPRSPMLAFPPRNGNASASDGAQPPSMPAVTAKSGASSNGSNADAFIRASVRLKVDDPTGNSYGTGTIVDARNGDALVLTCGHLFRDSKGKGHITVDLFIPGAPRSVPGRLVHYDLDSDLGLVSIRPGMAVKAIPIAPADYQISPGAKVVNVGCNNGNDPTARFSAVTTVDRYLGPANVQVAGRPVVGRSGGGVFSSEGYLIGVCFAADPTADEGLYRAHRAVHTLLDKNNMAYIYRQPGATAVAIGEAGLGSTGANASGTNGAMGTAGASSNGPGPNSGFARPAQDDPFGASGALANVPAINADNLPEMPGEPMPIGRMQPTSVPSSRGLARGENREAVAAAAVAGGNLTRSEEALLDEIRGRADSAEVICIIRSPGAQSEILVLDRASPALMEQLQAQRRANGANANRANANHAFAAGSVEVANSSPRATTELMPIIPVPTNAAAANTSSSNAPSGNGPMVRGGPSWARSARAVTQ